jgi:AraC-like DNA-binding protein
MKSTFRHGDPLIIDTKSPAKTSDARRGLFVTGTQRLNDHSWMFAEASASNPVLYVDIVVPKAFLANMVNGGFASPRNPELTLSPEPCIAVLIADPGDRQQVLGAVAPFAHARVCQSLHDVHASIASGRLTGLVCECQDAYGQRLGSTLATGQSPLDVPTLIFVRPIASDVTSFSEVVRSGSPALARVAGQADVCGAVRAVIERRWSPEASAPIVRQLAEQSPTPLDVLLVIAMIAGSKRLGVTAFAQLARVSERTLQRRLAIAGLPRAGRLLAWATVLHSAWRLEVGGERVKEASVTGGFLTREAFTSFIRRHAGRTVSHLCKEGSFFQALNAFLTELP